MNMWVEIMGLYPEVAFNYSCGKYSQIKKPKCKHFCAIEPYTVTRENWSLKTINKYDTFITWNKKFCEGGGLKAKFVILEGGCVTDNITAELHDFTSYDKKIKGILVLGQRGHNAYKESGNIYYLREEILKNSDINLQFATHVYTHENWGGSHYCGSVPGSPWGIEGLQKASEYLFNFCPENTYHSLWSYGYLCEKLFRSFKSKTVGLYLGCYNVEDYVPKDLFIDLRDFYNNGIMNWSELTRYLVNFSEEKYIEMTEKAFEWEKVRTIGRIENFENILENLV